MARKPLVYLAAPYTHGNQALNVHSQARIFNEVIEDGICTPFAPLIGSHLACLVNPRDGEWWMQYDFDVIRHCDAVYAQRAEVLECEYIETRSDGVRREIELCGELGIPVFYNKANLYEWAQSRSRTSGDGTNQRPENNGGPSNAECTYLRQWSDPK